MPRHEMLSGAASQRPVRQAIYPRMTAHHPEDMKENAWNPGHVR
jgi:hypothetical protein